MDKLSFMPSRCYCGKEGGQHALTCSNVNPWHEIYYKEVLSQMSMGWEYRQARQRALREINRGNS